MPVGLLARLLQHPLWLRYPVMLLLAAPALALVAAALTLFGQRPTSLALAFTQTYYHRFSELDHLCANASCGGHYLCSVAAAGTPALVRPLRYGRRGGHLIVCNRQLLVANAFEELIERRFPRAHARIRRHYDAIGRLVRRYVTTFERPWVANVTYVLMKPAEWAFTMVLYAADARPEERIARQYAS